jgi:hypothetical protein
VEQLEGLMASLAALAPNEPYRPSVGEVVAGQFTADDAFYRAKVLSIQDQNVEVQYVDYGNVKSFFGFFFPSFSFFLGLTLAVLLSLFFSFPYSF